MSTLFVLFVAGALFFYQHQVKLDLEGKQLELVDSIADKEVELKQMKGRLSEDKQKILDEAEEYKKQVAVKQSELQRVEKELEEEERKVEAAEAEVKSVKEQLMRAEEEASHLRERESEYQSRLRSTARLIDKMSRDHVDKHNQKATELSEVHNKLKAKLKEETLRGESMVYPRMSVKPVLVDETTVYRPFCVDNFAFRFLDFGDEANSMRARASKESQKDGKSSKEHCIYNVNKEHYEHAVSVRGQEFLPSSGGVFNFLSLYHYLSVGDEKLFIEVGSGGGRADFVREAFTLWGTPTAHIIEWNSAAFETLRLRQSEDKITFAQSSLFLHRGLPTNITGVCHTDGTDDMTGAALYVCEKETGQSGVAAAKQNEKKHAKGEGEQDGGDEKAMDEEEKDGRTGSDDSVAAFTLDHWFDQNIDPQRPVDMMRIQTDAGKELNVLKGLKKSLESRRVNILLLEYIDPFWRHSHSSISRAVGGLNSLGYDVYLLGARNLLRVSPPYWDERMFESVKWANILAVSKAHPLADRLESSFNIDLTVSSVCDNM
eukprot:CAMPEP_0113885996 /NCGR_PEP_ID=MMETSP0780_2-20120614/11271_1 /TAXON_ID=652834 /ORGANISM="Palpitomonas bilix" /LENGTH=545 /DNA_ID=CAMNT_0000874085 /DNA_START=149 /DNA_END=1786 /DNA_ORIENTATION=+ /assembly_acc=CAM_ASM_000599